MNQENIANKNLFPRSLLKTILLPILNYIRYSQMVPMILLYAGLIAMIYVTIQDVFLSKFLLKELFEPGQNKIITIGNKEILKIYAWLSLIVFVIMSFLNYILKFKVTLTFWKKMKTALVIALIGYGFIFVLLPKMKFSEGTTLTDMYLVELVFFIVTILASIYYFLISSLMNKIINYLNKDS